MHQSAPPQQRPRTPAGAPAGTQGKAARHKGRPSPHSLPTLLRRVQPHLTPAPHARAGAPAARRCGAADL
eukprot:366279-Chlamydomonas_euryale.AAC.10